jgi:ribosome production factor 2
MIFQSPLFSTHPTYQLIKSMLLDFFNGHALEEIPLMGLEGVICVTAGPQPSNTNDEPEAKEVLPLVHLRVYTLKLLATPTRLPKVQLIEMGPSIDFSVRRTQFAAPDVLALALRRPKLEKKAVEKGLGKKRKNIETDEMGDLVGRIHLGKQDLSGLQSRKMKGLKEGGGTVKRAKVIPDDATTESGAGGGEGRGRDKRATKAAARAAAAPQADDEDME